MLYMYIQIQAFQPHDFSGSLVFFFIAIHPGFIVSTCNNCSVDNNSDVARVGSFLNTVNLAEPKEVSLKNGRIVSFRSLPAPEPSVNC